MPHDGQSRVLLDECLPHDLRHEFPGFDVQTAAYAGVAGLSNGRLIAALDGRFDVLVTVDANLPNQKELAGRTLTVIVLLARSNRIEDLLPLVPDVLRMLETVQPGQVQYVSAG